MRPSKVHTCVFQEQVAMGKKEPNLSRKCSCRQIIEYKEANERVKVGDALWVVSKRVYGTRKAVCSLCRGEGDKTCDLCKGTGEVEVAADWNEYNGDIVLVNHRTKSNRISTPRVPTVEADHIERAVTLKNEVPNKLQKEAMERIEEYGRMTQWSIQTLGAELRDGKTKKLLIKGIAEPADNRKTGEGRNYDYGRTI